MIQNDNMSLLRVQTLLKPGCPHVSSIKLPQAIRCCDWDAVGLLTGCCQRSYVCSPSVLATILRRWCSYTPPLFGHAGSYCVRWDKAKALLRVSLPAIAGALSVGVQGAGLVHLSGYRTRTASTTSWNMRPCVTHVHPSVAYYPYSPCWTYHVAVSGSCPSVMHPVSPSSSRRWQSSSLCGEGRSGRPKRSTTGSA